MVKWLDKKSQGRIVEAIRKAESGTSGEIRVHMKRGATKDALAEARHLFLKMGMHRTRRRNGVLLFVSKKSRSFAIVGDEGIHRAVGAAFWQGARDRMQAYFSKGEFLDGIVAGVQSAGEKLKGHFPSADGGRNELSDRPTEG